MATLARRGLRCVGTRHGGPPHVQSVVVSEAMPVVGAVVLVAGTARNLMLADGTALVTAGTADKIDISDLTLGGEGLIAGITMGTATAAGQRVPVAIADADNIFEGTLSATLDGTTFVNSAALAQTHLLSQTAVVRMDDGSYVLSTNGGDELAAKIVGIAYGFAGESAEAGHGIIGDVNPRVRFIFLDALTAWQAV